MAINLILGDSFEKLKELPDNSVDSTVTDPPYHLTAGKKGGSGEASVNPNSPAGRSVISTGFMGKKWDGGDIAFRPEFWAEVLRPLKPGAFLVAFGGTRTYHRLACAIEDAGFGVRDALMWHYATGFPKSLNRGPLGTALKPATEIICLAQKPRVGTYEENLVQFGTGFLNIDGCRIPLLETDGLQAGTDGDFERLDTAESGWGFKRVPRAPGLGRWPANLCTDGSDEVVASFPESDGQLGDLDGQSEDRLSQGIFGDMKAPLAAPSRGDSGSAARFFFSAKAATTERDAGLDCHEIITIQCSAWEKKDQKARLRVDTAQLRPRVIAVSGAPSNNVSEWNMLLFGSESTAPFLKGFTFITKTRTSSIRDSQTLNWLLRFGTSATIADADYEMEFGGSHAENAEDGTLRIITTSAMMESALGVVPAPLKTLWRISVGVRAGVSAGELVSRKDGSAGLNSPRAGSGRASKGERKNTHVTVKPVALMRWLVRLVTPVGGTCIDPFMGSGTTGVAAVFEDRGFIGIERESEYFEICKARIAEAQGPLFASK